MLKKMFIILANFFKSLKLKEFIGLIMIPIVITLLLYFFGSSSIRNFNEFVDKFNSTVISIASILGAFSLASISIIITSSNENIVEAKKTFTRRKDRNNKLITYYKLQIMRNFFSLFVLFGLLIYAIAFTFIQNMLLDLSFAFYFETFLLFVAVFSQIFVIESMYFLFVEIKK
ncbi:hypothetical protein [Clostridium baratii]|uniref:hypothetical protein n=1 Tax=Clostridium baratii TaxID=1561 RepID=UPI0030CB77D2